MNNMRASARALIAVFIVLMIALSSTRVLDDYVDDYTDSALTGAALTYATARGINALVSMMQSSEIEAGVGVVSGSITVGELLDPLNDMIERFSTVMTWVGPDALYLYTAVIHALFVGFAILRAFRRKLTPDVEPIAFGDALASAATASRIYEGQLEHQAELEEESAPG